MAKKYFAYTRDISDEVVKDIINHRFNDGEIDIDLFDGVNIVTVDADNEQIDEWASVQNVALAELDPSSATRYEKMLEKTKGADYNGFLVPFTKEDQDTMVAIAVSFSMGAIASTNIEFSNGTVMPVGSGEFIPFAQWFAGKRNAYFLG